MGEFRCPLPMEKGKNVRSRLLLTTLAALTVTGTALAEEKFVLRLSPLI